jgi:hypothetical protein
MGSPGSRSCHGRLDLLPGVTGGDSMEEGDLPDPGQLPEADEPRLRLGEVGADLTFEKSARRATVVPPYPGGPWVGDRSQPETGEIQIAGPRTIPGISVGWGTRGMG